LTLNLYEINKTKNILLSSIYRGGRKMRKTLQYTFLLILISSFGILIGRSFRVQQIPNGSENGCANCHNNPGGGGPRNAFGIDVQNQFLDNSGNVEWGPALANLDSDGDGFSNGEELQDPSGSWQTGQPAPGDPSLVTNPGLASDFPTSVEVLSSLPNKFELKNNYPNPFNPSTTIEFSVPEQSNVRIEVFDATGTLINELVNDVYGAGTYRTAWNARDDFGSVVSSGFYIYRMSAGNFTQAKRMILIK
jgi:hypothetical protein